MKLLGSPVAEKILNKTKELMSELAFVPSLHVIRVGEDPASVAYVRLKAKRAKEIGLNSTVHVLPETIEQEILLQLIKKLNDDAEVNGILVQLPFPKSSKLDADLIINSIDPKKDVDGLHPLNVGYLWRGQKGLVPCTPAGIITLFEHYQIPFKQNIVIINRSNLVGKPLAALLLRRDATVTLAHSQTNDLAAITKRADVIVVATGRPNSLRAEMVRPGATIIDVGINRLDGALVGDASPEVAEIAGAITPVPGGVGPLTVAHLLYNTVLAAHHSNKLADKQLQEKNVF